MTGDVFLLGRRLAPVVLATALLAAGCGDGRARPKVVRIAYNPGPSELLHRAAERLAKQVAERSGGRLQVRLYPSGQLGNERELSEGLRLGCVDIIVTGQAVVGWYAPEFGALEAPFVFRDAAHIGRVWDSPIGDELRATMRARAGIRLLRPWLRGPRYLTTTSRKVSAPEDLKGLKLRVPELEVYIRAWQTFGANTTPIPFTDMFMALKLGVVDGQENPLATIHANHLDEVQRYIMETRHLIGFYLPSVGDHLERRFSPEERALLLQALEEATVWHNAEVERAEAEYRRDLERAGVEFVPLDTAPFRRLARDRLPGQFEGVWKPGLYAAVSEMGEAP